MAQTKEGAIKARETMYRKFGEDYFKSIGQKGGKKSRDGGFAHVDAKPRYWGRIGGLKSRRKPKNEKES